jgi:lipopolysaccharide heptosyltransferase II
MCHWKPAKNLLAIRLDTIGDVLMTEPALRALAQSAAGRRVTLLTSPRGAQAAALLPEIHEVLTYDAPWMKATAERPDSRPDHALIERLRRKRFDGAVVFTVYSQNPMPAILLCWLADIPLRLAHCRENPYQLLTDWVPDPEPERGVRHEVRRQLDLVAAVGATIADERIRLRVLPSAGQRVAQLLDAAQLDPTRNWIVMHTGASAASRRYPPEHFAEVGRRLVHDLGCQLVLTGSEEELPQVEAIRKAMGVPSRSLAGCLNLGQLAALLERADLLVSNNSGPVHVASAVGTPVVDLYALTNPQHTPWGVPHRVLSHDVPCKYCYKSVCPQGHHDCLRRITPQAVVQAVAEMLEGRAAGKPLLVLNH